MHQCKLCNYSTDILFSFNRHLNTQKHKDKMKKENERIAVQQAIAKTIYTCQYCQLTLETSGGLSKHHKVCSERTIFMTKFEALEKELHYSKIIISEKDKALCDMRETLDYERVKEKAHMSTSNYLTVTCKPQQNLFSHNDFDVFYDEDYELIDNLIYIQQNDDLAVYVGKILAAYYKTVDPNDQRIWNSDTERLTYFIRKKCEWYMDRQGVKTADLIIDPVLKHFKKFLLKFITKEVPSHLPTREVLIDNEQRQACTQILSDIKDGSLSKRILKKMAPYLYLNKQLKHIDPIPVVEPLPVLKQKRITK